MIKSTHNLCSLAIFLIFITVIVHADIADTEGNELKLVHVVFRHGERTSTMKMGHESYPNDPYGNYSFYPYGPGNLINSGKLTMFKLGTFLRNRYGKFLGDIYYPEITRVRSSQGYRRMMSAQLVNAGLWPPAADQQWNPDLLWMPIPYEYPSGSIDSLMRPYDCPAYKVEFQKILQLEEVKKLIEPHRELFAYLTKHTGKNITTPQDVFFIYHTLASHKNYNLTLPSWAEGYFPNGEMYNVTLLQYDLSSWGNTLTKIYGGPLLRDILKDYKKFTNDSSTGKPVPKITLYSGSESNICNILKALGLWTPHIPDFGAAIMFELHLNNSTNEFGVQVLHYLGKSGVTVPLTLPDCARICPIKNFTNLLAHVVPDDIDEICGIKVEPIDCRDSSASLKSALSIILLAFIPLKFV